MQGGLVRRKLSVRPSVKSVHCDKTEERSVQIFISYETSFSFLRRRMVGGEQPLLPEILSQPAPVGAKSAVTPIKKSSINTNRKSTTRFPVSLRWSSYVAPNPPRGAQKCKTAVFRVKSHFAWRKSATKFIC